jgi:hypothetical protein
VDSTDAAVLTDAISDAIQASGTVQILERVKMDQVLQEQGFEQSGACDAADCAVKVGRLLGIDQIVVGSIGHLGSSFVLGLRRVDVKTGEVLFSSSRSHRGDIETLLGGVIPQAVADLTGRHPKTSADIAPSRDLQVEPASGLTWSNLQEGAAVVTKTGDSRLYLDLARDPRSNAYDRYEALDSVGKSPSWIRLSARPDDPRTLGGPGKGLIVAGDFHPGQPLRKIPQLPLVFEFHAGHGFENPDEDTISGSNYEMYRVYHPVADLYAMCWFRVGVEIESWLGVGLELNILNRETFQRADNSSALSNYKTKNTYSPGIEIAWHKGYPIVRRLGVFWQIGGSINPGSDVVTAFTPLVGVSWELAPDLSLHGSGGVNMTVISSNFWNSSTSVGTPDNSGMLLNPTCGLSVAWTPRLPR